MIDILLISCKVGGRELLILKLVQANHEINRAKDQNKNEPSASEYVFRYPLI